jgi:hypothetical protein
MNSPIDILTFDWCPLVPELTLISCWPWLTRSEGGQPPRSIPKGRKTGGLFCCDTIRPPKDGESPVIQIWTRLFRLTLFLLAFHPVPVRVLTYVRGVPGTYVRGGDIDFPPPVSKQHTATRIISTRFFFCANLENDDSSLLQFWSFSYNLLYKLS